MCETVAGLVTQGVVEHIHSALLDREVGGVMHKWPGKRPRHKEDGQHSEGEQKQVAKPQRTAPWRRLVRKKLHRGKTNQVGFFSPAKVQPNGRCDRERSEP